jgi:predicted DNA-binding transcriptional regulator AlpA
MSSDSKDRMLPTRLVCERYNITDRTVDRRLENGILPTPVRINGLRYWRQRELEQRERQLQGDYDTKPPNRRILNERSRVRGTEAKPTRSGS